MGIFGLSPGVVPIGSFGFSSVVGGIVGGGVGGDVVPPPPAVVVGGPAGFDTGGPVTGGIVGGGFSVVSPGALID